MNRIGLLGYGTVGKGVKALLDSLPPEEARLVRVFDLPTKKEELGSLYVGDYRQISEDPAIDVVIECLGGDELPQAAIVSALNHKKHVISSNKETLSRHFEDYLRLAKANGVSLQFEASCGGGIPLLNPLFVVSRFDRITSLRGILNGTSNSILTAMQKKRSSFSLALEEAQRKGFAEKDPSADLEGLDMVRKAHILASLISGKRIDWTGIPHFGIAHVNLDMLSYFTKQGKTVRFVSEILFQDSSVSILIIPEIFPPEELLSTINEETNAVVALAEHNGPLAFVGKGAGQEPTASAILQDLERIMTHTEPHYPEVKESLTLQEDLRGRFYGFTEAQSPEILVNPSLDELRHFVFVAKEGEKR